jgi:Protein of unknown function (DUF3593)
MANLFSFAALLSCTAALLLLQSTAEAFVAVPLRSYLPPPTTTILRLPKSTPSRCDILVDHRQQYHPVTVSRSNVGMKPSRVAMRLMVGPIDLMTSTSATAAVASSIDAMSNAASTMLLAFTDQGQNLAGTFFQASLLPYLLFLYFLSFRANRTPDLANFGFQFVLLFVLSTIPSGIITRSVYGYSLADTDWLHGAAETLLTVANVFIVSG